MGGGIQTVLQAGNEPWQVAAAVGAEKPTVAPVQASQLPRGPFEVFCGGWHGVLFAPRRIYIG